ncbi:hypothetical protein MKEN_00781700 [Mycena kentingensis (nom. inval.)]|nr:hypothetical protein MKEN_00781700 [Mycena kentingensis (nom. inval.)]
MSVALSWMPRRIGTAELRLSRSLRRSPIMSASIGAPAAPSSDSAPPLDPPMGTYLSRKALPIKRGDAEPLTRVDVQYDLLKHIFDNTQAVFHSPTQKDKLVTFKQLYLDALYHSTKCSKVLKDKMVGGIAATLALVHLRLDRVALVRRRVRKDIALDQRREDKYHPSFLPGNEDSAAHLPSCPVRDSCFRKLASLCATARRSLQKSDGNYQDAPRIKNCLKAALLASEYRIVPPSTPDEILAKRKSGQCPPTSVVNLIFVLSNHAGPYTNVHFDGTISFLDLFLPKPFHSQDRARAFLWLMFNYLEDSETLNPFDDAYSLANRGKAPKIQRLTPEEHALQNVDPPDEIEWGKTMTNTRNTFLQRLVFDSIARASSRYGGPHPLFENVIIPGMPIPPRQPPPQPDRLFWMSDEQRDIEVQKRISRMKGPHYTKIGRHTPPPGPDRSMLDQAWHIVTCHDALADSDNESQDEGYTIEYNRRFETLKQLRGRSPTPEITLDDEPPRFQREIEWD